MPLKRFLLPPLDSEGHRKALNKLLKKHHQKGSVTMCWIEDVFPGERGWCDQEDSYERAWPPDGDLVRVDVHRLTPPVR